MEYSLGTFVPVADRVHVAVAEPEGVNVGLVVGSTGALLVDTGSSPEQGRAIRAAAEAVAGDVPLTHVVVTHAHHDHVGGLAAFGDLATLGHEHLARACAEGTPPPSRTFAMASAVNLGDCHVELAHFGRGPDGAALLGGAAGVDEEGPGRPHDEADVHPLGLGHRDVHAVADRFELTQAELHRANLPRGARAARW